MSKQRILIIEDEFELASMIKNYLVKEQYDVIILSNGGEALTEIERFQPQMLLLDLMLPGKDGLDILQHVRINSTIPVIIISAKETELDRILGLKFGADDYMIKPFSLKELVARVDALFRRVGHYSDLSNSSGELRYDDIIINLESRMVTRENEIVNFTQKEFDLFVFLLKHPRQALSKEQIYNNVWGQNEYGDINTIAIHVQKIREKLGHAHGITTIRGIGYRFDGELK